MKKQTIIGAAVAVMALPVAAQAQQFRVDAGVAANAAFESDGFDHIGNTVEGYLQGSYNGFYAGVWAATLDGDPVDDAEIEVYLGYGNELANGLSYSLTYTRYYLDDTGYLGYDVTLGLGYAINDAFSIGAEIALDPETDDLDRNISLHYDLNDRISMYALAGKSDAWDHNYAELGVSYALTDQAAVSLLYEDADNLPGVVTLTVSYDFNVFGG